MLATEGGSRPLGGRPAALTVALSAVDGSENMKLHPWPPGDGTKSGGHPPTQAWLQQRRGNASPLGSLNLDTMSGPDRPDAAPSQDMAHTLSAHNGKAARQNKGTEMNCTTNTVLHSREPFADPPGVDKIIANCVANVCAATNRFLIEHQDTLDANTILQIGRAAGADDVWERSSIGSVASNTTEVVDDLLTLSQSSFVSNGSVPASQPGVDMQTRVGAKLATLAKTVSFMSNDVGDRDGVDMVL